jgi:hypothetical protein
VLCCCAHILFYGFAINFLEAPTLCVGDSLKSSLPRVCPVKFCLPEFSTQKCVKWNFHVDNSKHMTKNRYDVILGRDLLEQLPSDVKFSDREQCHGKKQPSL